MKRCKWLVLAVLLTLVLPLAAGRAEPVLEDLVWRYGAEPAVSVLQGAFWGRLLRGALLTVMPFAPLACFLLERAAQRRARRRREQARPPESAGEAERRAFYLRQLEEERRAPRGTPWSAYAALCALGILAFGFGVLRVRLPEAAEAAGRDLALYRAGTPALYQGPLLLLDRPVRGGAKQPRFVYYRTATAGDLQCAAVLIPQPQLTRPSYRVLYLPETGTILSITDEAGVPRTGGAEIALSAPEGCWLYGDLAVPVCGQVEGYEGLTREQQALFDLLYAQVLSGDVAAGNLSTRSFALPYPLEKEAFNQVLALYESSGRAAEYPHHGYRTDDGQTVRQAYCFRYIDNREQHPEEGETK